MSDVSFEDSVERCLGDQIRANDLIASYMWAALANTWWVHSSGKRTIYSFREAGSFVARIRGSGHYMDWYCSASYGTPNSIIADALLTQGWTWESYKEGLQSIRLMEPMTGTQATELLAKAQKTMTEAELEEMDRPRLEPKCPQCGASGKACSAQAEARRLAEAFYRQEGLNGLTARNKANQEYPDLRYIKPE